MLGKSLATALHCQPGVDKNQQQAADWPDSTVTDHQADVLSKECKHAQQDERVPKLGRYTDRNLWSIPGSGCPSRWIHDQALSCQSIRAE